MLEYLEPIKYGIITFPFIAFVITMPYLLIHYHKYGSLPITRVIIVYSFILYLLVAYYLVIMPLPTIEEVLNMRGPSIQIIPMTFIKDLIKGINEVGLNNFYLAPAFYTIFFNVCLTIPFGVYLRSYFNINFKNVVILTFLLSLFFELTQLSGLYGIYPRAYRLFDVDDLIINTFGGIIGYFLGYFVSYVMPNVNEVNKEALIKGRGVSFTRRFTSFVMDYILYSLLYSFIKFLFGFKDFYFLDIIVLVIYYIVIPYRNGQTIANKYLKLKMVGENSPYLGLKALITRQATFYIGIFKLPYLISFMIYKISDMISYEFRIIIMLMVIFTWFNYYLNNFTKLKDKKPLFYERWSHTRLISSLKD